MIVEGFEHSKTHGGWIATCVWPERRLLGLVIRRARRQMYHSQTGVGWRAYPQGWMAEYDLCRTLEDYYQQVKWSEQATGRKIL